jgi:hypothetical protein
MAASGIAEPRAGYPRRDQLNAVSGRIFLDESLERVREIVDADTAARCCATVRRLCVVKVAGVEEPLKDG